MNSTGNDIVDLNGINAERTVQKIFYSKILSSSEQQLYSHVQSKLSFEHFIWLLWTIKEAAYKYIKRNAPVLLFAPTKIIVRSLEMPSVSFSEPGSLHFDNSSFMEDYFYKAIVTIGSHLFYSRSIIHNEFIHTVVNAEDKFDAILWAVKQINQTDHKRQSGEVRTFVLDKLQAFFLTHNLQITKSPVGYPVLIKDMQEMTLPISFSHHGRFISYSFLEPSQVFF